MAGPWRTVARLIDRLTALRERWPCLAGLSDRCLREEADADTCHLDYESDGLRLHLRFDRGPARRLFPLLSICDFGDEQISSMSVEGPPSEGFRDLENAIWAVVYEEAVRFERGYP
jgi:hypothetical protein